LPVPDTVRRGIMALRRRFDFEDDERSRFSPHITVYLCRIGGLRDFREGLRRLVGARLRVPTVQLLAARMSRGDGSPLMYIGVRRSRSLDALHRAVVNTINPIRGKMVRAKDVARMRSGALGAGGALLLRQFGYQDVAERFHPHVTVGTLRPHQSSLIVLDRFRQEPARWKASKWRERRLVVGCYHFDEARGRYVGVCEEAVLDLCQT